MKKDTILDLMVGHHILLEALFAAFSDAVKKNPKEAKDTLLELMWETKKHFFTEEEAVFNILPKENQEVQQAIKHLMSEHVIMTEKLKELSGREITTKDVEDFEKILKHHRQIEDKELYPKLDKELSEDLKREIISRVNEIPLGADLDS